MSLLLILTLIYVAVLVLALAGSLTLILWYLVRISRNLSQVQDLLTTVEERTRPLRGPVELLQSVAGDARQNLDQVKDNLGQADNHLVAFAGQKRWEGNMTVGIQIVWWIGLVGALLITLVILREVELVWRSLHDINELAKYTRTAAKGIAHNVEVIPSLANVAGPAGEIRQGAAQLAETTRAIEQKLAGLLPGAKK